MNRSPKVCNKTAALIFESIVKDVDAAPNLLRGALAISIALGQKTTFGEIDNALDQIVNTVLQRVKNKEQARFHPTGAFLAHLNELLFVEHVLHTPQGNSISYKNFCIDHVLKTFSGAPVIIAIIYLELLRRLGFQAFAMNTPGQVIVGIQDRDSILYIDPSNAGKAMSPEDLIALYDSAKVEPPENPEILTNYLFLHRILYNTGMLVTSDENLPRYIALLELESMLLPVNSSAHTKVIKALDIIYSQIDGQQFTG